MIETSIHTENTTEHLKLYSSKAISGATFLGGPLAGGYLIGQNYKALNKPTQGRNSLLIGIISTILLFGGMFMLPESTIDNIPRQLIPLLYTSIIWGIAEWKHGDILKAHKENDNAFFSGWRAAGVGFVSLLILCIGIFGYAYLSTDDELYERYDTELAQFSKNENETLGFYDRINMASSYSLINELDNKTIPKWKENIEIIKNTNAIENLPPELAEQNKALLRYAELRVQTFQVFRKAIEEDTDRYVDELEQLHLQIDKELEKLN